MAPLMDSNQIYSSVSEHYGNAARASADNGSYATQVAEAFGYSKADLEGMPEEANLGLSCGNPLAIANLKEGETACDLGSGAGFDVFQAAKKVGKSGKAIGVDFNKDMLTRANKIKTKINADNVSFVESPITKIDLPNETVDCMISNCVINLVPEDEKQLVFNEMFRCLRSGGRVAVSDILAKSDMPLHVKNDMALYVGCIAGASQLQSYEDYLRAAGFNDILIVDTKSDLNVYKTGGGGACCPPPSSEPKESKSSCCGGSKSESTASANATKQSASDIDYNEFAGSYKIYAIKP